MNNFFNYKRFGRLCKNEVFSNYKSWAIYFITIIGIYCLLATMTIATNRFTPYGYNPESLNNLFIGFLFLGGYIVSSLTFSDINDKFKSGLWFSLPGATLEKYLVGAVVAGIGYTVFLILSFFVASLVSNIITIPLFGSGMAIFNPLSLGSGNGINMWIFILIFILTNGIFLVGSIVFKKGAFIKTILVASIVQFLFSFIILLISFVTTKLGLVENWDIRIFQSIENYVFLNTGPETFSAFMVKWTLVPGIIFSLFFNVVGYFKLAEKEVKGGI